MAVAVSITADVGVAADRERAVAEALDALGQIDVVINNAGVGVYAPSWQCPMEELRRMFEVNFFGAVDLTQRLAPGMVARGQGLVVNVASIASKVPLPWFTLYSASKAALEAYTRGLRMELARTGVGGDAGVPGVCEDGVPGRGARRAAAGETGEREEVCIDSRSGGARGGRRHGEGHADGVDAVVGLGAGGGVAVGAGLGGRAVACDDGVGWR